MEATKDTDQRGLFEKLGTTYWRLNGIEMFGRLARRWSDMDA